MNIPQRQLVCSALAVASQATVYTNSFKVGFGTNFGIQAVCASTGTPAVRVVLEQSYLKLTSSQENASHTSYVVPDAFPDVFSDIVDTNQHIKAIFPVPSLYARYKIIGLAGNPSDTTITIYNTIQEAGRSN